MSKAINPSAMYEIEVKAAYKTKKPLKHEQKTTDNVLSGVLPLALIAYMMGGL